MKKEELLVSVVMTTYNRRTYLADTIKSVLNQTHSNLQFIIVDDHSTDGSAEVVKNFKDDRIELIILPENSQVSYATNTGMDTAKGKYIAYIDSDDIWEPSKLEKQITFMEAHPECGACFTRVHIIDSAGNPADEKFPHIQNLFSVEFKGAKEIRDCLLYVGNRLCKPTVLLRSSTLKQMDDFHHNLAFVQGHDYEFFLRVAMEADIYILPDKLLYYRWEDESSVKISNTADKGHTRFVNERIMAVVNVVSRMPKEQFTRLFLDRFRNPGSSTDIEIQCEKAFFLLAFEAHEPGIAFFGIMKLEELLNHSETRLLLKNKYRFSHKDLYDLTTNHYFNDYYLRENFAEEKRQAMSNLYQIIKEKEVLIAEYEASSSWRLTAPLRKLMAFLHKK